MNEIINKFLLVGDKFMPGIHLRQPGFPHSACGPFTKYTIMTSIIKNCKGEKKRGIRSAEGLREKLLIPDNEIYESIEHKVKSRIGTIFASEDTLEEYSVQIYEIDLYFS